MIGFLWLFIFFVLFDLLVYLAFLNWELETWFLVFNYNKNIILLMFIFLPTMSSIYWIESALKSFEESDFKYWIPSIIVALLTLFQFYSENSFR